MSVELKGYPVRKRSYNGNGSPIQTGAALCKARPIHHSSVFTSTCVGTSMPRYALSLPNLL